MAQPNLVVSSWLLFSLDHHTDHIVGLYWFDRIDSDAKQHTYLNLKSRFGCTRFGQQLDPICD